MCIFRRTYEHIRVIGHMYASIVHIDLVRDQTWGNMSNKNIKTDSSDAHSALGQLWQLFSGFSMNAQNMKVVELRVNLFF